MAASSIYSQQMGSLAILKRLKELDPSIATILGGFNVSGDMGLTVLRHFPSVDYVSFGEGDETIAQVCGILLGSSDEPMPYGVVGRDDGLPEGIPYRMTEDLDSVPVPDYRDFFEEVRMEQDGFYGDIPVYREQTYDYTVFLEGSRGCWWGAKRPCSFCGLNGLTNVYREKSPRKLYDEIREMTSRHPGTKIQLSDNVLSRNMIHELLPLLSRDPEHYRVHAEVKANLNPNEVGALSAAGVCMVQPGIESLNDHLLDLMGKGTSAAQNIALMKYCRAFRIFPVWNLLICVPGERREDYEQMLDVIPLIPHLSPPTWASPIGFMRFSRYADRPGDYGLELEPDPLYRCCFAGRPDIADNAGVFYVPVGGAFMETAWDNRNLYRRMHEAVHAWRKLYFSKERPQLVMEDKAFAVVISDSRPCATESKHMLFGLDADIYRLAWEPVSLNVLLRELPEVAEEKVKGALDGLIRKKLMICLGGKYLSLAVVWSSPVPA